jgi:hypothetical protein
MLFRCRDAELLEPGPERVGVDPENLRRPAPPCNLAIAGREDLENVISLDLVQGPKGA